MCRSIQQTFQYLPNLRPTSVKTPIDLKPKQWWSAALAALGTVYPATRR